jgi:osomolarity two-component system sensor histidine kinase TcsA
MEVHSIMADMNVVFDLSPIPTLVITPSLCIARASASLLKVLELTPRSCVGLQLFTLLQRHHLVNQEGNLDRFQHAIGEAIRTGSIGVIQITDTGASWSARLIPIFQDDVFRYLVLELQNLSKQRLEPCRPKEELSTDEAFRILVQTVKDYAIFLLDVLGNVATWNTGAELLKGYKREEIVGKHFSVFYGKEDLKANKPAMELGICIREGRVEDEGWRYRKDGTRFWANVVITAVYRDGIHVGFSKVTRDLTERKAAELRLIRAYEESAKLKSDFLANMSHEIRTPMHGMLSANTLLLDTILTEDQRELAHIIQDSGRILLQIIDDILDYSKLASGNFSIHSDLMTIPSIIASVVRNVQNTLCPGVHIELHLTPDVTVPVEGDPLRYRQIFQNILGNAAKFTDNGSIDVKASLLQDEDSHCIILTEVIDTGIGLPDAVAKNLFKPFTQFDNSTKKRYKGTGLGLSIAKSLTELMGGQIGFRPNNEGQGSIFWFTVKFKKTQRLDQVKSEKALNFTLQRPAQPLPDKDSDLFLKLRKVAPQKRLLVAEDNLINQKVIIKMLSTLGFRDIDVATDGAEATSMVCGQQDSWYDLILMDINMPCVDGHDATNKIRKSGITVRIVAMTAYALTGDRELCLANGMDDYLPKPVERNKLVQVLVKWLLEREDKTVSLP